MEEGKSVFGLDVSGWGDGWHEFDASHSPDGKPECEECLNIGEKCKYCGFFNVITNKLLSFQKPILCYGCKQEIYSSEEVEKIKKSKLLMPAEQDYPQIVITCANCGKEIPLVGCMLESSIPMFCIDCGEKIKSSHNKR